MQTSKLLVVLAGLALVLAITGCDHEHHWENNWDPWGGHWDLAGEWRVSEVDYDNQVVNSYQINIEQNNNQVSFLRGQMLITSGSIIGNAVICRVWDEYGFDAIAIDSDRQMHSEEPDNRNFSEIRFTKVR